MDEGSEEQLGRRDHPRLRLGVPARLKTVSAEHSVQIINLSRAGAHIALNSNEQFRSGVLLWLHYDCFAEVVWREMAQLGLKFDRPLPLEWLKETRLWAPTIVRQEVIEAHKSAQEWADGSFPPRRSR